MSDPIKDALRAACEAVCRYGDWLKCDPEPDCPLCAGQAAAAVAAFLRALPDDVTFAKLTGGGHFSMRFIGAAEDFDDLAAAVEEAARDG